MKYLSDRSKTRRRYINFVLGFVAFIIFIYYWPAFRSFAYPIAEPLMRGYGGAKGAATFAPDFISTYFTSRKKLSDRASELEVMIERLENELAERDARIREASLGVSTADTARSVPIVAMYPIAEDVTKLYSTILLSKGYRDGIEKGSLVYVRGMQAVCDIVEVYDRTALCELLSKGNRSIEGVTGSSTITLSLIGAGGGNFVADTSKGTQVEVGETVYLRSDQSYTLGTIVSIKEDEQDTGAKIYVRGAYNPVTSSVFYMHSRYAP